MGEEHDTRTGTGADTPLPPRLDTEVPPSTLVGRFITLARLGAGGMGVVYAAYDTALDRKVALKLLRGDDEGQGDARTARLLREAQAMAQLSHRNVAGVYDVGTWQERVFIAMELIDGPTLRGWLRAEVQPVREIVSVFTQAGRGLAAAHAAGLVHRDFKPDNVLVAKDGRAVVTDFGIATLGPTAGGSPGTPGSERLTTTGGVIGTPAYMAPEQRAGETVDARADQYSFCRAFAEALSGRTPRWLRPLLARGLAPKPSERHPSLGVLLDAVERGPAFTVRRALAASAFTALALGGVALVERAPATPCAGMEARLVGVWDGAARADVTRAFLASGRPFAPAMTTTVTGALDRWSAGWVAMRTDSCRATSERREQSAELMDRRMACLDRALAGTRAMVAAFRVADAATVDRGAAAVSALPTLEACADTTALRAAVPLPRDPAARARVAALRGRIDTATAAARSGHARTGLAIAGLLPVEARALAYRPVEGEALMALALAAKIADQVAAARVALEEAVVAAEAAGDDRTKVAAEAQLVFVAGTLQVSREEALRWAARARAALERLGGDDALEFDLLASVIHVELDTSRVKQAIADARRQVALAARLGDDDVRRADALYLLAHALRHDGQLDEALLLNAESLAVESREKGDTHPDLILNLRQRADLLKDRGRYAEAIPVYERVAAIARVSAGEESLPMSLAISGMGSAYVRLGRCAEAADSFERAASIQAKVLGPDHPVLATMMGLKANAIRCQGDVAGALATIERGRAILARRGLTEGLELGILENNAGVALRESGHPREGLAAFERALAAWKPLGPEHVYLASALTGMARCHLDLGDGGRAGPLLERAMAIRAAHPSDPGIADTHFALALALSRSEPERARDLGRRALARYREIGPSAAREATEVEVWLTRSR